MGELSKKAVSAMTPAEIATAKNLCARVLEEQADTRCPMERVLFAVVRQGISDLCIASKKLEDQRHLDNARRWFLSGDYKEAAENCGLSPEFVKDILCDAGLWPEEK